LFYFDGKTALTACVLRATTLLKNVGDTLRLLGAIEIHRNRAVYVSLNTNANPTHNPRLILTLTITLILCACNAFLWRSVNYNLAKRRQHPGDWLEDFLTSKWLAPLRRWRRHWTKG